MIYSNPEFLILLLATLTLFYAVRKQFLRHLVLVTASLAFYAWSGLFDTLIFLFVLLLSWVSVYFASRAKASYRRYFIGFGITVMLLHLFFWKYAAWLVGQGQDLFPSWLAGRPLILPLPIGISFFTLQAIAYLLDFQSGRCEFIGFKDYVLFKSFFPQLVAGPIVRARQLYPQLKNLVGANAIDVTEGISLFTLGFFKKVLIADNCAAIVDPVFRNPSAYGRGALVFAILGYTAQIWADFSGYTDMGRGAAKLFGIELPLNFRSPYLAHSPSDFWRRWHISLSEWIRDYIYVPLGGSRGAPWRVTVVALVTMLISGLWHGANWTFIIWGFYHGSLLVGERLAKGFHSWRAIPEGHRSILSVTGMFVLTAFGWLIFRSESVSKLSEFLVMLVRPLGTASVASSQVALFLLLSMFIQAWTHFHFYGFRTRLRQFKESSQRSAYIVSALICGSAILLALFFRPIGANPGFIYFKF